jgi:peroxiredoxin Q/BCP
VTLQPGAPIPDVTLAAVDGRTVRIRELVGKKTLVLYFYPKDQTPGCTKQACGFRDAYEEFTAAGAEVIGISADTTHAHAAFAAKHRLPFLLLSDPDGVARTGFGVGKFLGIQQGRVTFVVDHSGLVRHVLEAQLRIAKHITDALAVVKDLEDDRARAAKPKARR